MDLYVYVDDSLIVGDDAVIHMSVSESDLESDSFAFDIDEELTKYFEMHKRLNIHVTSGYENNQFSSKIKDLIRSYYDIFGNGEGRVFLVCKGKITEITDFFQ